MGKCITCLPRRTPVELLYGIVGTANGQGEQQEPGRNAHIYQYGRQAEQAELQQPLAGCGDFL